MVNLHRHTMKDKRLSLQRVNNFLNKLYPESLDSTSLNKLFDDTNTWTPLQLTSVTPQLIIDVLNLRQNGQLWRDSGKTQVAFADGDPVNKISLPAPYSADITPTATMYLRYKNFQWCLAENPASGQYGFIDSIPMNTGYPFIWGGRFTFHQLTNDYNIIMSYAGGEVQIGYWNDNKLTMFDTSAIIATSGSTLITNTSQTVFGAYSATANKGFIRQNGVDVFRGTTTTPAKSGFNLNMSFSGQGSGYKIDLGRLVMAKNGNISDQELSLLEQWSSDAIGLDQLENLLYFGFDSGSEYLTIHDSSDGINFRLASQYYRPANQPWNKPLHSVRDTKVFSWGGSYWFAHTWNGLTFGSWPVYGGFLQASTFGLAKATSWPLEWYSQTDVDCSDILHIWSAPKNISGAVNAGGLIKLTVTSHGYATGAQVRVAGVVGTTEANADWYITVVDANSFTLNGSTFTHAYVSGGTVGPTLPEYCFIADAGVMNGKAYVVLNLKQPDVSGLNYILGYKTSSDPNLITWDATQQITGSALPAFPAAGGVIREENGLFYLFTKNVTADPSSFNNFIAVATSPTGPYNTGRYLTELGDTGGARTGFQFCEGAAVIKLNDKIEVYYDRYTDYAGSFGCWRYTCNTLAGLVAGTELLSNETQCITNRGTIRHGSIIERS